MEIKEANSGYYSMRVDILQIGNFKAFESFKYCDKSKTDLLQNSNLFLRRLDRNKLWSIQCIYNLILY